MPIIKIRAATRSAMAQAFIADLDAGAGNATIEFYTGTQPAGPATAVTSQVKLGTLTCSDPSATETDGEIEFASITQDSAADATGTATWARVKNPSGVAIADFDVTNNAGTGAIKLNTVSVVEGGPISMSSFIITVGGA